MFCIKFCAGKLYPVFVYLCSFLFHFLPRWLQVLKINQPQYGKRKAKKKGKMAEDKKSHMAFHTFNLYGSLERMRQRPQKNSLRLYHLARLCLCLCYVMTCCSNSFVAKSQYAATGSSFFCFMMHLYSVFFFSSL